MRLPKIIVVKGVFLGTAVILSIAVLLFSAGVFAGLRTNNVCLSAWDRDVTLCTRAATVEDVILDANVSLGPEDIIEPPLDTEIFDGLDIKIERARPVFIHCRGKSLPVFTAHKRVSHILALGAVEKDADDIVCPGLDEEISPEAVVKVTRVSYGELKEEKEIAYDTQKRNDNSLEVGLTKVYKSGVTGLVEVVYQVRYEDGREVFREEKSRSEIREASPLVLLVGSLQQVSRGGQDIRFERALEVTATAYCPCALCCGPTAVGKTCTGVPAEKGVIAVDPSTIPLGTRLYVDGYGYGRAADVGSAIKGSKIDLCFDTHEEAMAWGLRKTKAYILKP